MLLIFRDRPVDGTAGTTARRLITYIPVPQLQYTIAAVMISATDTKQYVVTHSNNAVNKMAFAAS